MDSERILTAENVSKIFLDCLFREGEDTSNHVKSEGIKCTVGFHPDRLEGYRDKIIAMLQELPDQFQASRGEGWSFLNACYDRHGSLWTGEHRVMDQLFMLGIAIGQVNCLAPREFWHVLPGGMPYYVVGKK